MNGSSPRGNSAGPAPVSPRSLSNSLAGLTLTPPPNPNLPLSPRSLTPGSASPNRYIVYHYNFCQSFSNNDEIFFRSPRSDEQFDLELSSSDPQDYGVFARDPIVPQQPRHNSNPTSPPTINLIPPTGQIEPPSLRGGGASHFGGRLSPSITDDGEQPPYISSASPFLPTVSDVSYLSSDSSFGNMPQPHAVEPVSNTSAFEQHQGSFGEHPYGEYPSRTLFVRNIHSSVDDEELRQLFGVTIVHPSFLLCVLPLCIFRLLAPLLFRSGVCIPNASTEAL